MLLHNRLVDGLQALSVWVDPGLQGRQRSTVTQIGTFAKHATKDRRRTGDERLDIAMLKYMFVLPDQLQSLPNRINPSLNSQSYMR